MNAESVVVIVFIAGVLVSGIALAVSNRRVAVRDAAQDLAHAVRVEKARLWEERVEAAAKSWKSDGYSYTFDDLNDDLLHNPEHIWNKPRETQWVDGVNSTMYDPAATPVPTPVPDKFKQHKLACDSCDSPLSVQANQLAVCDFCGARYFLEGYEPKRFESDWSPDEWEPAEPYNLEGGVIYHQESKGWVDGGVSIRPTSKTPYAEWLD